MSLFTNTVPYKEHIRIQINLQTKFLNHLSSLASKTGLTIVSIMETIDKNSIELNSLLDFYSTSLNTKTNYDVIQKITKMYESQIELIKQITELKNLIDS